MALLEKLWDDVAGGPSPDKGLGKLRKQLATKPLIIKDDGEEGSKYQRSVSMPSVAAATPLTPTTPVTPTTPPVRKANVWRSVFNPGSNLNTRNLGAHQLFDAPLPNSPTIYDWLYSDETRSNHR